MPVLRRLRPTADAALARAAEALRDAAEAVDAWSAQEHGRRARVGRLDVAGWPDLPRAVRTEVLLRFLGLRDRTPGCRPRRHGAIDPVVERIDAALAAGRGGLRFDLPGRRTLFFRRSGADRWLEIVPQRAVCVPGNH